MWLINMIESFDDLKSKGIFKGLLCPFSIVINIEVVNITTAVDMTTIVGIIKVVFCNEIFVIINDPLSLLALT